MAEEFKIAQGLRAASVVVRALHVVAMALVLGGLALGGTHETLRTAIFMTISTGVALLAVDAMRGCIALRQVSGLLVLAKLALLGLGNLVPASRLPFYLVATFVAATGAHVPGAWRHAVWLRRREPRTSIANP